jgi:hypothetical protein
MARFRKDEPEDTIEREENPISEEYRKDEDEELEEREDRASKAVERDRNEDPITGEPGSHPVGVAGGGIAGGAAGATVGGVLGGPIGAVIGGAIGTVAGGAAGKGVAEVVDPTQEDEYWRHEYSYRPYYKAERPYEHYRPAYRYGWESATHPEFEGRSFAEIESELETNWPAYCELDESDAPSDWPEMREATRDAYNRIQERKKSS